MGYLAVMALGLVAAWKLKLFGKSKPSPAAKVVQSPLVTEALALRKSSNATDLEIMETLTKKYPSVSEAVMRATIATVNQMSPYDQTTGRMKTILAEVKRVREAYPSMDGAKLLDYFVKRYPTDSPAFLKSIIDEVVS